MKDILWEEHIPGGNHWSGQFRRGSALRLTDLAGGANVSALFFNSEEKLERYDMPDTLKAQQTAYLTVGHVCYSDMGRVLCSIISDTVGWHDAFCGVGDAELVASKYGHAPFQTHRNDMYRNGRDGLLVELAKWGFGKRDLIANVNFFSKVTTDSLGNLSFHAENSRMGDTVDLRFDMNTLVILSTAPHPLDSGTTYQPAPVNLTAWHAGLAAADDLCRNACPQNGRGFTNTERYYAS